MLYELEQAGFTIKSLSSAIKGMGKTTVSQVQTTRVGQWMSKTEYKQFVKTGEIPRTNVLTRGKEGYYKQANTGDYLC